MDTNSISTFKYRPFDSPKNEIRLLRLISSQDDGIQGEEHLLDVQMKHVSLQDSHVYHALSYVWGDPTRNSQILLNNEFFNITKSLHLLLRRFENEKNVDWLWADAICINQDDDDEKSAQVQMMLQIYGNAHAVLAWLGPSVPDIEYLMQNIQKEAKKIIEQEWTKLQEEQLVTEINYHPESLPSNTFWRIFQHIAIALRKDRDFLVGLAKDLSLINSSNSKFPHIDMINLLNRPLWTRVWILQEFAVAKELRLVCGRTELNYRYFMVIYYLYYVFYEDQKHDLALHTFSNELVHHISALFPVFWQTVVAMRDQSFGSMEDLLLSVFRLGATDPRDRVFALIGLAKDSRLLGLYPNYSKTYSEVCIETAWRLLRQLGLRILTQSRGLRLTDSNHDLPSWVPDWSLRSINTLRGHHFDGDVHFSAAGATLMCIQPSLFNNDLKSKTIEPLGIFVATVCNVGDVADFSVPRVTSLNMHKANEFLANLNQIAGIYPTFQSTSQQRDVAQEIWQIPIAHANLKSIDNERQSAFRENTARLRAGYDILSGNSPVPSHVSTEEDRIAWQLRNCHLYLETICRKADMKRPFACSGENKYLGMGPMEMHPSDQVYIFHGESLPFIIRPQENGRYKLVGEAYVYGIMHGEVLETNPKAGFVVLE